MNNERGRVRRLRLMAGVVVGLFAGTAHALVTHAVARHEPAPMAAVPVRTAAMGDLVVVDLDGRLLLVVVDEAGGDDDATR